MIAPAEPAGDRWRLARLWRSDRAALEGLYLGLRPEDRRMRFFGAVSDARIRAYCASLGRPGDVVVGAWSDDDRLVGAAELRRSPDGRAEIALVVADGWRRRGIGAALLGAAVTMARNRFERRLFVTCLAENRPMRTLAARAGVTAASPEGEVEGRLRSGWPSAYTWLREATLDGDGIAHAFGRLARRTRPPVRDARNAA